MSAAREIEVQAARWLVRREEPGWTDADQAGLDAWLDESMAHKAAYWRLEHGWREADRIGSLGAAPETAPARGSGIGPWWTRVAVAASLAALLGFGAVQYGPFRSPEVVAQAQFDTPVGGRKAIGLPDGSRVELNTATVVRAAVGERRREIWLERGEAYFEVTRAEGRPFVVHAGPRTVTVLGTKFSVRRDDDRVTVSVLEGRVRIDDAGAQPGRSSIIAAGDMAIARGPSTLVAARAQERVESALAWRQGMLTFDQATLAEAAAEFNRYNVRPILVTDPEAAGIRIGGTFQAANVDAFVRLLRDAYGLTVTAEADAVRISS